MFKNKLATFAILLTVIAILLSGLVLLGNGAKALTATSGWLDCPFGMKNDPYPGKCRNFVDRDGNGICDHSEAPPEIRGYTYPDNGTFLLLTISKPSIYRALFQSGKILKYEEITMDTAPFIDPTVNRTMVPLRFVSESLDLNVEWDAATREIRISNQEMTVIMSMPLSQPEKHGDYLVYPGSPIVKVIRDGEETQIDLRDVNGQNLGIPFIYNSRTFVPLRFVSEIFGAQVQWHPETRSITITKG